MKYSTYLIHIRAAMKLAAKGDKNPRVYTCNVINQNKYSAQFPEYKTRALNWIKRQFVSISFGTTYFSLFYDAGLDIDCGYPMLQFRIYMINRMIGEAKLEESQAKVKGE